MPKTADKVGFGYIEDTLHVDKNTLVFKDSTGAVIDKAEVAAKLADSEGDSLPKAIIVEIEATHSGITKNMTEYMPDTMEKSAPSWTSPYNKPVLREHNSGGQILGRVRNYEYKKSELNPDKYTIKLTLEITDKDSIRRHLDGTALTYSIGGQAKEVHCSICGIDILNSDSFCGHWKGYKYEKVGADGKTKTKETCIWRIGMTDYLEVSEVNIPADEWAQNLSVKVKEEDALQGAKEEDTTPPDTSDASKTNITDGLDAADALLGGLTDNQPTTPETPPAAATTENTPPATDNPPAGDPPPSATVKTAEQYEQELKDMKDKLEAAQTAETAAKAELQIAQDKVAELTGELNTTKEALTASEAKVSEVTDKSQQTFKTSVEIAKTLKRVYAESIADSKIRTNDLTEDKREEEVSTLVVKSAKELSDILGGLKTAEKARKPLPKVGQENVGDEGAGAVHQDRVDVDDGKKQAKDSKPMTAADAVDMIVNANK